MFTRQSAEGGGFGGRAGSPRNHGAQKHGGIKQQRMIGQC